MTLEPAKKRVYGLQGFVRGTFTKVGNVPDDTVYAWPNLLLAELFVFVLTVSLILWCRWPSTRRSKSPLTSCTRRIRPRRRGISWACRRW